MPALVFGIPGDAVTAIAIGVLYMKGMNPGPTVFIKNPSMLYAVFLCFFLANLLLIPVRLRGHPPRPGGFSPFRATS